MKYGPGEKEQRINALAHEVHEVAKEHGWWDQGNELSEIIDMLHAELSEAVEAFRNWREANEIYYEIDEKGWEKPEGVPVELADCAIRILDFLSCEGIKDIGTRAERQRLNFSATQNFSDAVANAHFHVSAAYQNGRRAQPDKEEMCYALVCAFNELDAFLENEGLDMLELIEEKNEYNKGRMYRHGGKRM